MKIKLFITWMVLVTAAAASAQETATSMDSKKLLGDWEYVSGQRDGEDVAEERLMGTVTITEETWTLPGGPDEVFVMSYKIDASKDPATIDFNIEEGPVPEGKALGLLSLEDGMLTLCYHPMGEARPEKLESTADNGAFLFVLKRKAS